MPKTVPVGYGLAVLRRPIFGAWTTTITATAPPALKFNVRSNSQFIPVIGA